MSGNQGAAEEAAEAFARDTADHELTILHDDGLYRHLRFVRMARQEDGTRKPSSFYWFDLITWPGCLVINGDMESFTFSRTTDMLEFFRGHQPNHGYWAEKLCGRPEVKRYDDEKFRQLVAEAISDEDGACEKQWPGLAEAVREQVLGNAEEVWDAGSAMRVLGDFEFGASFTALCSCGTPWEGASRYEADRWETSHRAMAPIGSGAHQVAVKQVDGFRFSDTWEWDLTDWTHQFLWCCNAIQWGIAKYDEAKAGQAVAVVPAPETASVAGGVL